jgi:hypothetical protein
MLTISQLESEISRYKNNHAPESFVTITQDLQQLSTYTFNPSDSNSLKQLLVSCATTEPIWGLLLGLHLWQLGCTKAADFHNVWNCSRYAGIQSRYSSRSATENLAYCASLYVSVKGSNNAAQFITAGNAYRQLHRYAEAERAYLQGLDVCVDDPFLKFRLVDLCLMTYQHDRAKQLLSSLRSRFPYAVEMLFHHPVPDEIQGPAHQLPDLKAEDANYVWLVAADPVYTERYGVRLANSIVTARQTMREQSQIYLHLHVVNQPDKPTPVDVINRMNAMLPISSTQRTLNLDAATDNQRSAVFASERFIFLAEILAKYNKPILVSDIDVECLQDPYPLFGKMGDADIGYTRFHTVRDAWDKYPATVLLFKPTAAAIDFCKQLSGMIITLLNNHPHPWFVDQVALFRLIEGGLTPAKLVYLKHILTDTDSPNAYFRILHGSCTKK